jgi:hypothetical protein
MQDGINIKVEFKILICLLLHETKRLFPKDTSFAAARVDVRQLFIADRFVERANSSR